MVSEASLGRPAARDTLTPGLSSVAARVSSTGTHAHAHKRAHTILLLQPTCQHTHTCTYTYTHTYTHTHLSSLRQTPSGSLASCRLRVARCWARGGRRAASCRPLWRGAGQRGKAAGKRCVRPGWWDATRTVLLAGALPARHGAVPGASSALLQARQQRLVLHNAACC